MHIHTFKHKHTYKGTCINASIDIHICVCELHMRYSLTFTALHQEAVPTPLNPTRSTSLEVGSLPRYPVSCVQSLAPG